MPVIYPPFERDDKVEVRCNDAGFRGAWFEATVLRVYPLTRLYKVVYDSLLRDDDSSKALVEEIHYHNIRPRAPRALGMEGNGDGRELTFRMHQVVDAYHNDAWWVGKVTEVHDGGVEEGEKGERRYTVCFFYTGEDGVFKGSELRVHLNWTGSRWTAPLDLVEKVDEGEKPSGPKARTDKHKSHANAIDKTPKRRLSETEVISWEPGSTYPRHLRSCKKSKKGNAAAETTTRAETRLDVATPKLKNRDAFKTPSSSEQSYTTVNKMHITTPVDETQKSSVGEGLISPGGEEHTSLEIHGYRAHSTTTNLETPPISYSKLHATTDKIHSKNNFFSEMNVQQQKRKAVAKHPVHSKKKIICSFDSVQGDLVIKRRRGRPSKASLVAANATKEKQFKQSEERVGKAPGIDYKNGTPVDSAISTRDQTPLCHVNEQASTVQDGQGKMAVQVKRSGTELEQASTVQDGQGIMEIQVKCSVIEREQASTTVQDGQGTMPVHIKCSGIEREQLGARNSASHEKGHVKVEESVARALHSDSNGVQSSPCRGKEDSNGHNILVEAGTELEQASTVQDGQGIMEIQVKCSVIEREQASTTGQDGQGTMPVHIKCSGTEREQFGARNSASHEKGHAEVEESVARALHSDFNGVQSSPCRGKEDSNGHNILVEAGNHTMVPHDLFSEVLPVCLGSKVKDLANEVDKMMEESRRRVDGALGDICNKINSAPSDESHPKSRLEPVVVGLLPVKDLPASEKGRKKAENSSENESSDGRLQQIPELGPQVNKTATDSGNGAPEIRLPFVKSSSLWESIESMKVFSAMPQQPHFGPLEQCCEELREGNAIGVMVNFANLVDNVLKLKIGNPRVAFEDKMKDLVYFEAHGFDVHSIRSRLEGLLTVKDNQGANEEKKAELEGQISVRQNETLELSKKIDAIDKSLAELAKSVSILRERRDSTTALSERINAGIVRLQGQVLDVEQDCLNAELEFSDLLASPW